MPPRDSWSSASDGANGQHGCNHGKAVAK